VTNLESRCADEDRMCRYEMSGWIVHQLSADDRMTRCQQRQRRQTKRYHDAELRRPPVVLVALPVYLSRDKLRKRLARPRPPTKLPRAQSTIGPADRLVDLQAKQSPDSMQLISLIDEL
jgi:hypothetical protein